MNSSIISRRKFVTGAGALDGIGIANATRFGIVLPLSSVFSAQDQTTVDYTLHIKASPIEIAPKRIISVITYNGQFPGPLLRFKEGRQVTVDIYNDTDTPEQPLAWSKSSGRCGWGWRRGGVWQRLAAMEFLFYWHLPLLP